MRDLLLSYRELVLSLDQDRILHAAVERARSGLGTAIALGGRVEDGDLLVLRHWSGTETPSLHDLVVPVGLGLGGKASATGRPQVVAHYVKSSRITHHFDAPVADEGVHTMAAVPIEAADGTRSVVYVGHRDRLTATDRLMGQFEQLGTATSLALDVAQQVRTERTKAVSGTRQELALDLHDSVGALLFRIGVEIRDLAGSPGCSEQVSDRLKDMENRIGEAAMGLRECVAGLRRDRDDSSADLRTALSADCAAYQERCGVTTRLVALSAIPPLDDLRAACLRRCVRESLLNVEKHADASCVVVSLAAQDDGVLIAVSDDGADPPSDTRQPGIGIASLTEEFGRLGGWFEFVHEAGEGGTARGWLPQDT
nr:GAF domain-containing protein [Flexivirga oryzae]